MYLACKKEKKWFSSLFSKLAGLKDYVFKRTSKQSIYDNF